MAPTSSSPPRRRRLVLAGAAAAAALPVAVSAAATGGEDGGGRSVVVTSAAGDVLARVPVGEQFAVSYRNSLYGTLAEERYTVLPDTRFRLEQIAADQVAVLEEYYGVPGAPVPAPAGDRRTWVVPPDPDHPLVLQRLSVAATDLGERTLHVPGAPPVPLWPLVDDEPTVVLDIEESA